MVYLPTKLGDFVRANVGIHIPAPWSIWVKGSAVDTLEHAKKTSAVHHDR